METQWYYTDQGQRLGPVSPEQLKQLATSGRLRPSDMVWKQGMAQWVAANQIKGLFSAATPETPPPLPVARSSAAPASSATPPPSTGTRVCEWCAKSISEKAFKCPRCQKWRRDIAEDRRQFLTFYAAGSVSLIVAVILFPWLWRKSSNESPMLESNEFLGIWHDRIENPDADFIRSRTIMGKFLNTPIKPLGYRFSLYKFLTSFWAWLVIVSCLLAVSCGSIALFYQKRLRQKTGMKVRELL
jgi:hypothetical protein